MRTLIFLIFMTVSFIGFSQSKNQQRINELSNQIEQAVERQDFDRANELQNERKIRIQIETAIKEGDFDKAESLKRELDNPQASRTKPTQPANNEAGYTVRSREGSKRSSSGASYDKDDWMLKHRTLKNGLYMDFRIAQLGIVPSYIESNYDGYNSDGYLSAELRYAMGFNLGNRFFFGAKNKKVRVGLDLQWINFNVYLPFDFEYDEPRLDFAVAQPGLAVGFAFNEKAGMDFHVNGGLNLFYDDDELDLGAGFGTQLKFRYNAFAVGFAYKMAIDLDYIDFAVYHLFGLTVGFKF